MAKKSRKQRKLLKEENVRRSSVQRKTGDAYSNHKIRICYHYSLNKYDEECFVCTECRKSFNSEQTDRLNEISSIISGTIIYGYILDKLLTEDIFPCKYYYADSNEIVFCGTERCFKGYGNLSKTDIIQECR